MPSAFDHELALGQPPQAFDQGTAAGVIRLALLVLIVVAGTGITIYLQGSQRIRADLSEAHSRVANDGTVVDSSDAAQADRPDVKPPAREAEERLRALPAIATTNAVIAARDLVLLTAALFAAGIFLAPRKNSVVGVFRAVVTASAAAVAADVIVLVGAAYASELWELPKMGSALAWLVGDFHASSLDHVSASRLGWPIIAGIMLARVWDGASIPLVIILLVATLVSSLSTAHHHGHEHQDEETAQGSRTPILTLTNVESDQSRFPRHLIRSCAIG